MTQLWDISPPVSARSAVFPGDTPYTQHWRWSISATCPVNVSEITLSPHTGAHADAPLHYDRHGKSAGQLALEPFLGPCRVMHIMSLQSLIQIDDLAPFLKNVPTRVLVKTREHTDHDTWTNNFAAFAPSTLEHLASLGVVLVGLDTPSIDPASSKTLDSHQVIRRLDMRVLENLMLNAVPAGDYELIALPLALADADASPVRAVLRALPAG